MIAQYTVVALRGENRRLTAQACDLTPGVRRGPWVERLHGRIRARVAAYADDRPTAISLPSRRFWPNP